MPPRPAAPSRVMCISYPGRVVAVTPGDAVVEIDGRRRHASTLLLPEISVGDWVIVGVGSILRRLDPDAARDLVATLHAAGSLAVARAVPEGAEP
jgi:hydrogenase assembly chaperone HypC/HupF